MNIIIGNAWPYANGPLHLGRIAVLLPGDILARYHRMMGDDVVFLSGTDCHGTPVTMKAKEEGITPLEAVEKYHAEFQRCFKLLGFSFDIFAKTHSEYHEEKVNEFILELYKKGYIYENVVEQTFCENCNEYLSDRYTKSCQNWIDFANKLYQNVKDEEKIKYINIFHKSSLLEIDFWRMCEE